MFLWVSAQTAQKTTLKNYAMKNLCSTSWRTGQMLFHSNPLTFLLQVLILQTGISLILSNVPWDTIQQSQWHCFLFFLPPGSRSEVLLLLVFWMGQKLAGSIWGVYGGEGCCCIYLWMEGGRGTTQHLVLIWQPKHSWFPSDFLEALSHTLTKLSLLSNSFVPSLEQDYLGEVQLEHRVIIRQGLANSTSAMGCSVLERVTLCSPCQAVALCSAGRSPAPLENWCWEIRHHSGQIVIPRPASDEWEHFFPTTSMYESRKLPGVFISWSVWGEKPLREGLSYTGWKLSVFFSLQHCSGEVTLPWHSGNSLWQTVPQA